MGRFQVRGGDKIIRKTPECYLFILAEVAEQRNEFVIMCKIYLHIEGKLSYSGNISNLICCIFWILYERNNGCTGSCCN